MREGRKDGEGMIKGGRGEMMERAGLKVGGER